MVPLAPIFAVPLFSILGGFTPLGANNLGVEAHREFQEAYRQFRLHTHQGDLAAERDFEKSAHSHQMLGLRFGEAASLCGCGFANSRLERPRMAAHFFRAALNVDGSPAMATEFHKIVRYELGVQYSYLGLSIDALRECRTALAISRQLEDGRTEAKCLNAIGGVYLHQRIPQTAIMFYTQARSKYRQVSAGEDIDAMVLDNLGAASLEAGDLKRANDYCARALETHRQFHNKSGEATAIANVGEVQLKRRQTVDAMKSFQQALAISRRLAKKASQGWALDCVGEAYFKMGKRPRALASYLQALAVYKEVDSGPGQAGVLKDMVEEYSAIGHAAQARRAYLQGRVLWRMIGDRKSELEALSYLQKIGAPQKLR